MIEAMFVAAGIVIGGVIGGIEQHFFPKKPGMLIIPYMCLCLVVCVAVGG